MGTLSVYGQMAAQRASVEQRIADAQRQMHMHEMYHRHRSQSRGGATSEQAARQLLGVGPDASPADIRAAFAARVKEAHPDSGGKGGDIQQLKQARNLLLEDHRLPKNSVATTQPCAMCRGSGRVAVGFGNEPCTTCNGTGVVS